MMAANTVQTTTAKASSADRGASASCSTMPINNWIVKLGNTVPCATLLQAQPNTSMSPRHHRLDAKTASVPPSSASEAKACGANRLSTNAKANNKAMRK